ncbi:MAG: hypothetical protein H0Z28_03610 [Archaeoglobus sp.]|nr:hypothetical protein [Archaeoglobus sp.]
MVFDGLVEFITSNYSGKVVEVGTGCLFKIALELQNRGLDVLCTDMREIKPPEGIKFVKDDVNDPNLKIYQGSSLIYSIRPPQEIFQSILSISERVKADCIIKPLPDESPAIPAEFTLINYKGDFFYLATFKKKD